MAFSKEQIEKIVHGHKQRVATSRLRWQRYLAAYEGRFWQEDNVWTGAGGFLHGKENDNLPVKVQVNVVRPWVEAHQSNLFYRRPNTLATRDTLSLPGEPDRDPDSAKAVGLLCDRFLRTADVAQQAEYGFQLGLMYGPAAFKIGISKGKAHPLSRIWVDTIPAHEVIWDQRSTRRQMRYMGHIRQMAIEDARSQFENMPSDDELDLEVREDVIRHGMTSNKSSNDGTERDNGYITVLEWYDLTGEVEISEKESLDGVASFYLVTTGSGGAVPALRELRSTAPPFSWPDGRAAPPIVPIVLQNRPDHPMDAIEPVDSIYHLNAERNFAITVLANAFRRDSGRAAAYDKTRVDSAGLAGLLQGDDHTLIGIDGPANNIVEPIEFSQVTPSLERYFGALQLATQDAQGTSDLARGLPASRGKTPLSAQEAALLADVDKNTSGRIQKRMDEALGELCRLYLRVVLEGLEADNVKSVKLQSGRDEFELSREQIAASWSIKVVDTSSTPVREAQRRQEFLEVQTLLLELATIAGDETALPLARVTAQEHIDYIVQVWDLPPDFAVDELQEKADALPPPPEPEPLPEAQPDAGALPVDPALLGEQVGLAAGGPGGLPSGQPPLI